MIDDKNIRILDTTLRDGEQAPGVSFNADLKMRLLSAMIDAGIRDFEIGTPAVSVEEQNSILNMLKAGFDANLSVWCRARLDDLKLAKSLGCSIVNLSLPVSEIQLSAIGKNKTWAIEQLHVCLKYANDNFEFITVGAQDGSRADLEFLFYYLNECSKYSNVKRIRIADTVGILNPFSVNSLFQKVTSEFPNLEFEFHGHNDLGMANANGLAAFKGGAQLVSGTLNGLGERCGNTAIEELLIALEYSDGIKIEIDKSKLRLACDMLEAVSGRKIPISKPFNGEMCFTHESGIHTRSLLINELSYQPFKAEETGGEIKFLFGKHSGSAAIKSVLLNNKIELKPTELNKLVHEIKRISMFSSGGLSSDDIMHLYHKLFDTKPNREKRIEFYDEFPFMYNI